MRLAVLISKAGALPSNQKIVIYGYLITPAWHGHRGTLKSFGYAA